MFRFVLSVAIGMVLAAQAFACDEGSCDQCVRARRFAARRSVSVNVQRSVAAPVAPVVVQAPTVTRSVDLQLERRAPAREFMAALATNRASRHMDRSLQLASRADVSRASALGARRSVTRHVEISSGADVSVPVQGPAPLAPPESMAPARAATPTNQAYEVQGTFQGTATPVAPAPAVDVAPAPAPGT